MKHILIINHNAGSPVHGPNFRSYYSALGWLKKGYKVTIICSAFSHKLKVLPRSENEYNFEDIDGINYIWIKTSKYKNNIGRLFNYIQFFIKLNKVNTIIEDKVDYVICSSPPPIWIFFAKSFARSKQASLIFEARDLWPDVVLETSNFSFLNPFVWFMGISERVAYSSSDHVVSVNKKAFKVMKKKGLCSTRFTAIPNGVSVYEKNNNLEFQGHIDLCKKLKAQGWFIVGYSGSLSKVYCLEYLIKAAKKLEKKKVAFIFAGMGPLEKNLIENSKTLCNVYLIGWLSKNSLQNFLSNIDLCFAGLLNIPSFIYGSDSTKLYEYMKAKKPILQTINNDKSIVAEAGCGKQIKSEDADNIAEEILNFKQKSKSELDYMGSLGFKFLLENNTFDKITMKWITLFKLLEKKYVK